jgi:hypothetical protein
MPFSWHSVKSWQAALTAAAQLLHERGFHGFTVDEVARLSGVTASCGCGREVDTTCSSGSSRPVPSRHATRRIPPSRGGPRRVRLTAAVSGGTVLYVFDYDCVL